MKKYKITIIEEKKDKGFSLIIKDDGKLNERMAKSLINYVLQKVGLIIRGIK